MKKKSKLPVFTGELPETRVSWKTYELVLEKVRFYPCIYRYTDNETSLLETLQEKLFQRITEQMVVNLSMIRGELKDKKREKTLEYKVKKCMGLFLYSSLKSIESRFPAAKVSVFGKEGTIYLKLEPLEFTKEFIPIETKLISAKMQNVGDPKTLQTIYGNLNKLHIDRAKLVQISNKLSIFKKEQSEAKILN